MLVGRERDLAFLKNAYQSPKRQLLVLYGQRRVGKTALLKAFSREVPCLYYRAASCSDGLQRSFFFENLLEWGASQGILEREELEGGPQEGTKRKEEGGRKKKKGALSPPTWREALERFASLPSRGKKSLLILDDFPLLLSQNEKDAGKEEDFLTALLSLWKERLSRQEICIILAGSDEAFFERRLPSKTQSLYASATGVRKLLPLKAPLTAHFLPNAPVLDQFHARAILGGIPAYLSCLDPSLSLAENLQRELLSPRGRLSQEVPFLLREALREPGQYQSILYAIATGSHTLSEITLRATQGSSAKCAVYLKNLEELSLVEKQVSLPVTAQGQGPESGDRDEGQGEAYGKEEEEAEKSKDQKKEKDRLAKTRGGPGRYRITSPLLRFWFALMFPRLSSLEEGQEKLFYEAHIRPGLPDLYQLALEEEALSYLQKEGQRGTLPFSPSCIGPWFGKTTLLKGDKTLLAKTSIPALAFNEDKTRAIVAACSYGEIFTYARYLTERTKLLPIQAQTEMSYYLFSAHGFDPRLTALEKESPFVTLIPLEELMRPSREEEKGQNNPRKEGHPRLTLTP